MIVSAIAAVAENGVIGRAGGLPWHLPDDLRHFQRTTRGHHVITGRRNYESIPPRFRPLKDRVNLVVTRNRSYQAPGAVVVHALEEALEHARRAGETEAFIIGGGELYHEALAKGLVQRIHLTRVHTRVEGDVHFPAIEPDHWAVRSEVHHPADDRHVFPFTITLLDRTSGPVLAS